MDVNTAKKIFFRTLKDNGGYSAFIKRFNKRQNQISFDEFFDNLGYHKNLLDVLYSAFIWPIAEFKFWCNMHETYVKNFEKYEIKSLAKKNKQRKQKSRTVRA